MKATAKFFRCLQGYELVFLFFAPLYAIMVAYTGFPFSYRLCRLILSKTVSYMFCIYGLAALVTIFRALHLKLKGPISDRRELFAKAVGPYLTKGFFFRSLSRTLILLFTLYFFLHLKHLVLWWHRDNFDLLFWNFDRAIHIGLQPNIVLLAALRDLPELVVGLDWLYTTFFVFNVIVPIFFLIEVRGEELANRFCTATCLLWFLGGLLYVAFPADGPCYAILSEYSIPKEQQTHIFPYPVVKDIPQSYAQDYQAAKIWKAKGYQERLWSDRRKFMLGERVPTIFYGIAAFPSLHLAVSLLFSLFLFKASVLAGVFSLFYAAAIGLGSVVLQWHYAIDAYSGGILAFLAYFLTSALHNFRGRLDS